MKIRSTILYYSTKSSYWFSICELRPVFMKFPLKRECNTTFDVKIKTTLIPWFMLTTVHLMILLDSHLTI